MNAVATLRSDRRQPPTAAAGLDPATAARLTAQHFDGGHMFYVWETSRHAFTAAISQVYDEALG